MLLLGAYQLIGRSSDGGTSAVEARVAHLERQVQELAGRTPPPGIDAKVIDDLNSRVAKLESTILGLRPTAIDPTLLNRIATLEGALKALDEKLGIVARRTDDISVIARDAREKSDATAKALAELAQKVARLGTAGAGDAPDNRIATLERATKVLEAELAKRGFGEAGDRAVRLAVTASALNAAVERGDAFVKELAAAKTLTENAALLAPLEPFASTGLPPASALGRELTALLPTLSQSSGAVARDGSFLDRLQANAERLVRIRPINEGPGDDPSAVLARLERSAAQADIAGALAELGKLPPDAQARAQTWSAKAQARMAAIAASRRFAAESFAALAP